LAAGDWSIGESNQPNVSSPTTSSQKAEKRDGSGRDALLGGQTSAVGHVAAGLGLPSQGDFTIVGEALVTDAPLTFLGYVNRTTGVIEEEDHPANGLSLAGKVAIFPRGTGSSVAPYVLLELYYRGVAPVAILNTEIDQQTAPACSLEGIPYAYGFDTDVTKHVKTGDVVSLERRGDAVHLRVVNVKTNDE
jgi:predicted aconitase with swiveling domain